MATEIELAATLLSIMRQFLNREIDVETFVSFYQRAWKVLRDRCWETVHNSEKNKINPAVADAFDGIFTASDCFRNPSKDVCIDENRLRFETKIAYNKISEIQRT